MLLPKDGYNPPILERHVYKDIDLLVMSSLVDHYRVSLRRAEIDAQRWWS